MRPGESASYRVLKASASLEHLMNTELRERWMSDEDRAKLEEAQEVLNRMQQR
jgi:hypothetical protein